MTNGIEETQTKPLGVPAEAMRLPGESSRMEALDGSQSFPKSVSLMVGFKLVDTFYVAGKNILSLISNKYLWFLPVEIM